MKIRTNRSLYDKKRQVVIDCSVFFVTGLVLTVIWFRDGLLFASGELGLTTFYNSRRILEGSSYVLQQFIPGLITSRALPTVPFHFFGSLSDAIGISPVFKQAATIFFLLSLAGLFMYYLTSSLLTDETKRVAAISAGLFYMLSPFTMRFVWHRASYVWFITPVFPIVLALYIKGLNSKKSLLYVLLINFVLLLFAEAFVDPVFIPIVWFLCFSAFLMYILQNIRNRANVFHAFKFSIILLSLWFLLNSWWFLSLPFTDLGGFQTASTGVWEHPVTGERIPFNIYSIIHQSDNLPLSSVFRLIDDFTLLWMPAYSTIIFVAVGFTIPILVFGVFLFKRRNKFIFYFACLALFGLFVCKGTQPPLGDFTLWLYKTVWFLQAFRALMGKLGFILNLSYAFLFGVAVSLLYHRLENLFNPRRILRIFKVDLLIVLVLLSLILGVLVYPMWTGEVFTEKSFKLEERPWSNISWYVEIPPYYQEADTWLSEQKGVFRIIVFPMGMRAGAEFNWSSGYFAEYPWNFFNQPTIATVTGGFLPESASPIDAVIQKLPDVFSKSPNFWKIMGLLNAKYIMIQGDSVYPSAISYITAPPKQFSEILVYGPNVPDFDRAHQISACETTESWSLYGYCWENITVDNSIFMEGSSSLNMSTRIPEVKEGGVRFNPEGSWNMSSYQYLSFWIEFEDKSIMENINEVICEIWDSNGNHRRWVVTDQVYGYWSRVDVPLGESYFWQGPAPPDLSSIDSITVSLLSLPEKETSANWRIDDVQLVPSNYVDMEHIYPVKTFGKLAFYQVDEEHFVPTIYATNQFFKSLNVLSMCSAYTSSSMDPRDKIAFLDSQASVNNMTLLTSLKMEKLYKPNITFQQINPTKYKVSVHNATQPFFLVLSSTYHKEWKAYIDGEQFSEGYHFIVNGYANAWYVNKDGTYNLIIEFLPQRLVVYGSLISVMTFAVCATYLTLKYSKKRIRIKMKIGK